MFEILIIQGFIIVTLLFINNRKKEKIIRLENNWEAAKKVIASYDPEFAEYVKNHETC